MLYDQKTTVREKVNKEDFAIIILLSFLLISFLLITIFSKGSYGGADPYLHYLISHYSLKHPILLLHHWGKPVYTLLGLPFAYFGFTMFKIYTVIASLLTAYLSYRIAQQLDIAHAWLSIVFVLFTPIYFLLAFSGLTEPVFSLCLVSSIYLFSKKKYFASAIVISFLILIRTEGFIILPLFALAFLLERKFVPVFFILTGSLIYSIIGYFCFHDFFWLINANPYKGGDTSIFGHGELFHFFINYKEITELPLAILFLLGITFFFYILFKKKEAITKSWIVIYLLILSSLGIYILAHSYAWWTGEGSIGLLRVIGGVTPLIAIIAVAGFNLIFEIFSLNKILANILAVITVFFVVRASVLKTGLFLGADDEVITMQRTADWIKNTPYFKEKFFYFNPVFCYTAGIDPWEVTRTTWATDLGKEWLLGELRNGDIIIWDAHFGPQEGRIPVMDLLNNEHLKLIKRFAPDNRFCRGQLPWELESYEVFLFQKVRNLKKMNIKDTLKHLTFENNIPDFNNNYLTEKNSHSGSKSLLMDEKLAYSPGLSIKYGDAVKQNYAWIHSTAYIYPTANPKEILSSLVISCEKPDGVSYHYLTKPFDELNLKLNEWNVVSLSCFLPLSFSNEDVIKSYVWHQGEKPIYVDDFLVEIEEPYISNGNGSDTLKYYSFETNIPNFNNNFLVEKVAHSGKRSLLLDTTLIYSPGYAEPIEEITGTSTTTIHSSVFVYPVVDPKTNPTSLIISCEKPDGFIYQYSEIRFENLNLKLNQWNEIILDSSIPQTHSDKDILKVYTWHQGKKPIYIDDFLIQLKNIKPHTLPAQ